MNKELPKVTIITTTFNLSSDHREAFFPKCCESVHNQTYPNIEHIVQDGASTDGSLELIHEYEKKGWLKCYSEPDKGINDGYNKALAHATGKYIFFLNSDDEYFSPEAIELCVKAMEKEKADYCYGIEKKITRDGRTVEYWKPCVESFWYTVPWSHMAMGVRRDVLERCGNFDKVFPYGGDYFLMVRLLLGDYKGVEIDKTISLYRLGGISSVVTNPLQTMKTIYIVANVVLEIAHKFDPTININDCINIIKGAPLGNVRKKVFPKYFRRNLMYYLINLNLKNFNYNKFIQNIHERQCCDLDYDDIPCNNKKRDIYFCGLKIMSIKVKGNYKRFKLFGFIPLIKIKE